MLQSLLTSRHHDLGPLVFSAECERTNTQYSLPCVPSWPLASHRCIPLGHTSLSPLQLGSPLIRVSRAAPRRRQMNPPSLRLQGRRHSPYPCRLDPCTCSPFFGHMGKGICRRGRRDKRGKEETASKSLHIRSPVDINGGQGPP